jgi:hypothetical protein
LFVTPEEIAVVNAGGGEARLVARGQTPAWGRVPGPAQGWRRAEPERITDWQLTSLAYVENAQLSRDGRHLAYSRGEITGDLWLVELAKP